MVEVNSQRIGEIKNDVEDLIGKGKQAAIQNVLPNTEATTVPAVIKKEKKKKQKNDSNNNNADDFFE